MTIQITDDGVFINGKNVKMTNQEIKVLSHFLENENHSVKRTELQKIARKSNNDVDFFDADNLLKVIIFRLRGKLSRNQSAYMINTVYGYGYKLIRIGLEQVGL